MCEWCGTDRCGCISRECEESRREALIAMVHTIDSWDGDDFFRPWAPVSALLRAIVTLRMARTSVAGSKRWVSSEDLAMGTWRAPQPVSFAHLSDQVTDLARRSRPSRP
jgi:hypothetical protein